MTKDDALDILSLKRGATEKEIKSAYRRLVLKFHADQGGSDALMRQINEAYETLSGKRTATQKPPPPPPRSAKKPNQSSQKDDAEAKRRAEAKRKAKEKAAREQAAKAAEDQRRAAEARKAEAEAAEARRQRQAKEAELQAAREKAERDRQEQVRNDEMAERHGRQIVKIVAALGAIFLALSWANDAYSNYQDDQYVKDKARRAELALEQTLASGRTISGHVVPGSFLLPVTGHVQFRLKTRQSEVIVRIHQARYNYGHKAMPPGIFSNDRAEFIETWNSYNSDDAPLRADPRIVSSVSIPHVELALTTAPELHCSAVNPDNYKPGNFIRLKGGGPLIFLVNCYAREANGATNDVATVLRRIPGRHIIK